MTQRFMKHTETSLSSCRLQSQTMCVREKMLACRSAYGAVYCLQIWRSRLILSKNQS